MYGVVAGQSSSFECRGTILSDVRLPSPTQYPLYNYLARNRVCKTLYRAGVTRYSTEAVHRRPSQTSEQGQIMGYESQIQFTLDTICPWYGTHLTTAVSTASKRI